MSAVRTVGAMHTRMVLGAAPTVVTIAIICERAAQGSEQTRAHEQMKGVHGAPESRIGHAYGAMDTDMEMPCHGAGFGYGQEL